MVVEFTSLVTETYKSGARNLVATAARASDGLAHVLYSLGYCSTTQYQDDPWWRIDLMQTLYVRKVTVRNRNDPLYVEFTDVQLRIGESTDIYQNKQCGDLYTVGSGSSLSIECGDMPGRYLSFNIYGKDRVMSICEVAVYNAPQPGHFTQRGLSEFYPSRTVSGAPQNLRTVGTPILGDQVAWSKIAPAECRSEFYFPENNRVGDLPLVGDFSSFSRKSLSNGAFEDDGGIWEPILRFPSLYTPRSNTAGSLLQPLLINLPDAWTALGQASFVIPNTEDVIVGEATVERELIHSITYNNVLGSGWNGDVKSVYTVAYAVSIGIYNITMMDYKPGMSMKTTQVGDPGLPLVVYYTIVVPEASATSTMASIGGVTGGSLVLELSSVNTLLDASAPLHQDDDAVIGSMSHVRVMRQSATLATVWSSDWSNEVRKAYEVSYAMAVDVYDSAGFKTGCNVTSSFIGSAGLEVNFTTVVSTQQQSDDALVGAEASANSNPRYDLYKLEDIKINQIPADEDGYHYYQFSAKSMTSSSAVDRDIVYFRTKSIFTDVMKGFGWGTTWACKLSSKGICDGTDGGWELLAGMGIGIDTAQLWGDSCERWAWDQSADIDCPSGGPAGQRCFAVGTCSSNTGGNPHTNVIVSKYRPPLGPQTNVESWSTSNAAVIHKNHYALTSAGVELGHGFRVMAINATKGAGHFTQSITNMIAGYTYTISWSEISKRAAGATGPPPELIVLLNGETVMHNRTVDEDDWDRWSITVACNASFNMLTFRAEAAEGYIFIDDVAITESVTGLTATSGHTTSYLMFTQEQNNPLHTHAESGIWHFCLQPFGGVWTLIEQQELTVVAEPSYFPTVGIAGSITPLQFRGGLLSIQQGGDGTILEDRPVGDVVVIKVGNCSNAQSTVTSETSIPTTELKDEWVFNYGHQTSVIVTSVNMSLPETLVVCFATAESQVANAAGNSEDDYVALATLFRHRRPTDFMPKSVIVEGFHRIDLTLTLTLTLIRHR